jgi:hypothetical protein
MTRPVRTRLDRAEKEAMTDITYQVALPAPVMKRSAGSDVKWGSLPRPLCRALGLVAAALAVAAAIIGLRLLAYGLGHPGQPLFREFSRLWS